MEEERVSKKWPVRRTVYLLRSIPLAMSLMCLRISLKPNLFSMMVFLAVSINATQMICNKNRFRLTRSVVTTFYFLCGPLYWRDIFSEHILWSLFLNTMFYSRQLGYFILMDILTPSCMDYEVSLWPPSHWFYSKRFPVLSVSKNNCWWCYRIWTM